MSLFRKYLWKIEYYSGLFAKLLFQDIYYDATFKQKYAYILTHSFFHC